MPSCSMGSRPAGFAPSDTGARADELRGSVDRLERRDDLCSMRLEEWCQHDLLAERGLILVHAEARPVARDLEQDAVGLAEIQTAEPEPVHLSAVRNAER